MLLRPPDGLGVLAGHPEGFLRAGQRCYWNSGRSNYLVWVLDLVGQTFPNLIFQSRKKGEEIDENMHYQFGLKKFEIL